MKDSKKRSGIGWKGGVAIGLTLLSVAGAILIEGKRRRGKSDPTLAEVVDQATDHRTAGRFAGLLAALKEPAVWQSLFSRKRKKPASRPDDV